MVSTSAYDGLGRRITKVVTHSGDLDMTYHFYYEGQSIIEIRNGSDLVLKQHVWANFAGGYIDELIENDVNADPADGSEQDCELRGWACQDANYNVIGFVDDDLAVLERYEYTPYGERTVFYSAGSNDPLAHTPTRIPRRVELSGTEQAYGAYAIGHQGLYHDEETASGGGAEATLIYNRARMLHTRLGRFTQRDPLGYVDGRNLYQLVRSNPVNRVDPMGTYSHQHDCTQQQLQQIQAAEQAIQNVAGNARNVLLQQFNQQAFLNNYPVMGKQQPYIILNKHANWESALSSNLHKIQSGIASNSYGVECECSCDQGTDAYVRNGWNAIGIDDDVHLCPGFFNSSAASQAKIFYHELTHYYAGTEDYMLGNIQTNPQKSWSKFAHDAHWLDQMVNGHPGTVCTDSSMVQLQYSHDVEK